MFGLGSIASKVFGSSNDRKVKKYQPRVDEINALEPELAALSDDATSCTHRNVPAAICRRNNAG